MNIQQYVQRLRRRLGDTDAQGYYTTTELEEFGSEAQRDIALRLHPSLLPELHLVSTGDINTTSAINLPSNISQIDSLTLYNSTNQEVEVRLILDGEGLAVFRGVNRFFAPDDGIPIAYLENQQLIVVPDKNGMKFKLRYVRSLSDITGSGDMALSDRWEDLALDYGEMLALKKEKRTQEAQFVFERYLEKVKSVNDST